MYLDAAFDFGEAYRYEQAQPIRQPPPAVDTTDDALPGLGAALRPAEPAP